MARRLLLALLPAVLLAAACGDDDTADDDAAATTTIEAPADEGTEPDDEAATTTASTTTSAPDAEAEAPPAGTGGVDEGAGDDFVYVADLSGDEEVPGPGDANGAGRAEIRPADEGRLCFDMVVTDLDADVTDAHVHEGAAGEDGPPVVTIGSPTSTEAGTDTWSDVCVAVDDAVAQRLAADVERFYVNVHTADHPQGAVRGQLSFATIFDLELS